LLFVCSSLSLQEDEGGEGGEGGDGETEEDVKFLETQRRLQEEARDRKRSEFGDEGEDARLQHEGFRAGLYVRVLLRNVPVEFIRNFQPHLPVVVGGLAASESALGFVRARIKRHRWHKRILKSNNPIIFSVSACVRETMPACV
jgi:ribosome biogenesis protein BMS1